MPRGADGEGLQEIKAGSGQALLTAMGGEAELARRRWARGCRSFALCEGGEIRAYGWLSHGPEWIGEAALEIRPPAGDAYLWNCVTLASHRRRGHFRTLVGGVAAQVLSEGVTRLWIGSVQGSAEAAVAAAGFEPALVLDCTRIGPLRLLRVSAAAGATPALAAAARAALAAPRLHFGRFERRRH